MTSEKKECWLFDVRRNSTLKVVFSEPLTYDEAIEAFMIEEYEDVIDEEDCGLDVLTVR